MCALPKGFIKKMNISPTSEGVERRQEILNNIDRKGMFLPKGVSYEDMDKSFIDFANNDISLTLAGEKVPVVILTIQRWSEFAKTWQKSDKYKNIKLPFITIVRKPNIQSGTNQAGNWNIPGGRGYSYYKIPTFEGGRKGMDVYKIPQPTAVDITYDVRLFCGRMRDLNTLHNTIQKLFNSRQHYIYVNEHPMPLLLEEVNDESKIEDFENRRYYVQAFNIKLQGYILDENDFEVIPTVNRLSVSEVVVEESPIKTQPFVTKNIDLTNNNLYYNVIFKQMSSNSFSFVNDVDIKVTEIISINGLSNIEIKINGVSVFIGLSIDNPIFINNGDTVDITVVKNNPTSACNFTLKATIV